MLVGGGVVVAVGSGAPVIVGAEVMGCGCGVAAAEVAAVDVVLSLQPNLFLRG